MIETSDNKYLELDELRLVGRGPHRLEFEEGQICKLSDREAMGLSGNYVPGIIEMPENHFNELNSLSKEDLISIVESKVEIFIRRFVAGQILALKGDPRIKILAPEMIEIEGWTGKLGLDETKVEDVVSQYRKYGVIAEWIIKETPEYEVNIKPFKMGKYPVTNLEYLEFLKETKHTDIPSSWIFGQFPTHFSNHPVYSITSDSCVKYAEWLSFKTKRSFRLPTEAEWEYAAGGSEKLEFPWGNDFLPDCCNTVESGIFQTTAIGAFNKGNSPFGCQDMAGNVEEFTADYYRSYPGAEKICDDLVSINGEYRVARGGSFTRFRDLARCKRRHGPNPAAIYAMGFRLAEDID